MFEAREFLRKKLIGKKVNVSVDYVKPAQDSFPEKTCCTVTREGMYVLALYSFWPLSLSLSCFSILITFSCSNIAEALISKGLATCLWHRQDDDQRSPHYDDLRAAEERYGN